MGDRGPGKRMTMADFIRPPQPPATTGDVPVVRPQDKAVPGSGNQSRSTDTAIAASNGHDSKSLSYSVRATKKGGVPCVVESRKGHKVVVLTNIEGDASALLSALQKSLGTGGVRKGNSTIEVQGEHHFEKIKMFCLNSGCMVGASKQNKAEAESAAGKKIKSQKKKSGTTTANATSTTTKPAVDGTAVLPSLKELKVMKPKELKEQLAARQLSTQGNKKELLARLVASVQSNAA